MAGLFVRICKVPAAPDWMKFAELDFLSHFLALLEELAQGQVCDSSALIDETSSEPHVTSALACYRHCLAASRCTHFEWAPGAKKHVIKTAPKQVLDILGSEGRFRSNTN